MYRRIHLANRSLTSRWPPWVFVHKSCQNAGGHGATGYGLVEGSLDERLRWEGGGSRPADEATLSPGIIEVGKTGPDEGRAGWLVMYVGDNAAARQRMPEGQALRNPWRLVNNANVSARAAMCAMCDELTRDPIGAQPPPCSIGVQLDTAAISPAARQRRAEETAKLAGWLATGVRVLLVCDCRSFGEMPREGTRCHADGVAAQVQRQAARLRPEESEYVWLSSSHTN